MTVPTDNQRMIDGWFPCAAVDEACGNSAGSGLNEKAIFPWFASRPIAQARAAVACALLGDDPATRQSIEEAVRGGRGALDKLAEAVAVRYPAGRPVVLDVFSGRGIIPLEAARLGAVAVGLDLSPVATLAGRILADYPLRDWRAEPPLPWTAAWSEGVLPMAAGRARLITDLEVLLAEVGDRMRTAVAPYYPPNPDGSFPWGYLWAISIPCDGCGRRFPLVPFSAVEWRYFAVFWPGNGDVEEGEDVALGGGEPVQHDAVLGVGQPQALEGGQDVASGGAGRATLGQQPVQVLVGIGRTRRVCLASRWRHSTRGWSL